MNKKIQQVSFVLTVVLVLALSAIATVPVLADSGPTPPTTPSSGGRSSNKGSSNSLSQVPSGTKVVIVDSSGNKVALGSQAAQDILNSGDPIWCPSSVMAPTPGAGGCTQTADNLYDLIAFVSAGDTNYKPTVTTSTIWILSSAPSQTKFDSSSLPIFIDGSSLDPGNVSAWANFALTLKGGWNGTGLSTVDINNPSQFTVPIWINNWKNAVTVSNLTISSATGSDNGLQVDTTGNITLTNVQSNGDASMGGAYLNNCEWNGTNCVGTGTVTVTNSQFNNDYNTGLSIHSKGAITLNGVTANSSTTGAGAYIDNCNNQSADFSNPCTSTATVTITGTNTFNDNYFNGLEVYSNGNITAGGLNADSNSSGYDGTTYSYYYSGGVQLENDFSGDKGTITITGTNYFTNNYEDGLDAYSNGAITTNNLNATGNGVQGAPPQNWQWVGVTLANTNSPTPQNITINGVNDFENNFTDGLDAEASGSLTVNNVTANNNGTSSTSLTSYFTGGVGANLWATKGVTVNNSTFNGNYSTETFDDGVQADYFSNALGGLTIFSAGAIKVNNVTASGDLADSGADLDNCLLDETMSYCTVSGAPTVTLTGLNTFSDNAADGLDVNSFGSITSSDINAGENSGIGVNLFNANVNASPTNFNSKGTVTLTGTDVLNDNVGDGLDITSNGAIEAGNIHAINNSGSGADLDNSNSTTPQTVTLTNSNSFSYSGEDGLDVFSNGAITLSTLSANGNGNTGVYLDNCANGGSGCTTPTSQSVTLSGNDSFNDNYADGLDVYSNGIISVKTTTLVADGDGINGSSGDGVYLDNSGATSVKTVTLSGASVFNGNYAQFFDGTNSYPDAGLYILSRGNISVNNITANDNVSGAGALLDNCLLVSSACTGSGTVTITGFGTFNNNDGDGLDIYSKNTVTLTKITADDNLGDSGSLYNGEGLNVITNGKLTLTCGEFANNVDYGIDLDTGLTPLLTATVSGATLIDNGSGDLINQTGLGNVVSSVRTCSLP